MRLLSMSSKYGCCKAARAEILLFGSKATRPERRSTSSSFKVGVCSVMGMPRNFGKVDLKSFSFKASGQLFSLGVPRTLNILKI